MDVRPTCPLCQRTNVQTRALAANVLLAACVGCDIVVTIQLNAGIKEAIPVEWRAAPASTPGEP